MSYSCTICFEHLVTHGDVPAVLQCGHVYHRNCINHWFSSTTHNPQCPLCKKKVSRSKIIAPIYLCSNDEYMASSSSSSTIDSTEQNLILQQEIIRLKQLNNTLEAEKESEKQKAIALENRNRQLDSENMNLQRQKRLMKAVRKVANLDERLGSDASKTYLRGLRDLPSEDLLVHLGTWRAKCELSIEKTEKLEKALERRERENLHLTKKCERYKGTINKSGQSSSKPTQLHLRKSFENVIVLDTDSEDENQDDSQSQQNLDNNELVDNDEEEEQEDFRVEEHNTSHVNHRSKRRIDLSDDDEDIIMPRRKKVFQINLIQDDDEDRAQAGPSSSDYSA